MILIWRIRGDIPGRSFCDAFPRRGFSISTVANEELLTSLDRLNDTAPHNVGSRASQYPIRSRDIKDNIVGEMRELGRRQGVYVRAYSQGAFHSSSSCLVFEKVNIPSVKETIFGIDPVMFGVVDGTAGGKSHTVGVPVFRLG